MTQSTQTQSEEASLTDVPFISDARQEEFLEAGYETPEEVASASVDELADAVYGVGETTAVSIITGALDLMRAEETVAESESPSPSQGATDAEVEESVEQSELGGFQFGNTESASDVDAETFARRLVMKNVEGGGTELMYRDPETESLITPYYAPGFEAWCAERGRDPESFRNPDESDGERENAE